jgi:hypothetical protein
MSTTKKMSKARHRCLCSLLAFILLMASPTVTTARDVCAPGLIPPADATKICEQVCAGAQPLSQWNGQWNNDSPTCHWFWYGQYGVCGCDPIPCRCTNDGGQTYCDESLTRGGPNTCSSNCNCTEGRRCVNGWCQGTPGAPCCGDCRPRYQTCMTLCNTVPIQGRADCQSLCGAELNTCTSGCQQCPK